MAIVAYGEITILDLIDTATYIYYSANSDGSGASKEPGADKKYIGIYSGAPFKEGQPSTPPKGTTWTKYVGENGQNGQNGSGFYKIITKTRRFTQSQWNQYNTPGHVENWTYQTDADTPTSNATVNAHIKINDTAYVSGVITDKNNIECVLIGIVVSISNNGITLKTTSFIASGEKGEKGDQGNKGDKGDTGNDGQMLYATCSTPANTSPKKADLQGDISTLPSTLPKGTTVTVNFTYSNTVQNPQLNIANSGNKNIWLNGKNLDNDIYYWVEGDSIVFVYDGEHWVMTNASALIKANDFTVDLRDNLEEQIDDAAKTATNFLYFGDSGLEIGYKNNNGAWGGNRTQITSDSFNILNSNGNILASYGANEIILGKNNESRAQITKDSFILLDSNGIQLSSFGTDEIVLGKNDAYKAQVKSDSFNILDKNGNQLSSFGANKIELGKNNENIQISLCNGYSSIYYDPIYGDMIYTGDSMHILGRYYAAITAQNIKHSTTESYIRDTGIIAHATDNDDIPYTQIYAHRDDEVANISSYITVQSDSIAVDSQDGYIQLRALTVTTEGDHGVTGHFLDNQGFPIRNGLAVYESSGIDANTTLEHLVLTNINVPSSAFYYVHTVFYSSKSINANRAQFAIPYNFLGTMYYRTYYNGAWTQWWAGSTFQSLELHHDTPYIDFHSNNYTGDYTHRLLATDDAFQIIGDRGSIDIISKEGSVRLSGRNGGSTTEFIAVTSDRMYPSANNEYYLGNSSNKWKAVYAVNGTIQTSDRNQKTNIQKIEQKYIDLFDKLQPVTFEFSDNNSDRVHVGFISQDVKDAMDEVGLTDLDFAGYCRDVKMETEEITNPETKVATYKEHQVIDENGEPVYEYSLRYTEFIALNTKMIQLNQQKISEQEEKIQKLEEKIELLESYLKFENSLNL